MLPRRGRLILTRAGLSTNDWLKDRTDRPMGDSGSKLRAFLAELQRRRVFRVAVVYAIASFGILQVVDIAFPALKFPEWSITLVVALVLLGFPVAMVLAWAFDITPRGVVRTDPLPEETASYRRVARAPALIVVGAVSALTVAAGWYFLPRLPGWWSVNAPAAETRDARTMLVVLPFANLGSPVDEYFAEGVTEEITARLAGIHGLGVIARTTAIQYKNTDKTVKEIGDELGVDYVLEGTVRWENIPDGTSRVRVTPQLIRVADATHVWAHIYEEPMSSVFQVQSEIAERVVEALDVTLLEPERLALKADLTTSTNAYQFYLLGNQYLTSSTTEAGAQEALEMFERAIELDPDFKLARNKLAEAHAKLYWGHFRLLFGVQSQDYEDALDRLYLESFGSDTASYYLAKAILHDRAELGSAKVYYDSARSVLEPQTVTRPGDPRLHAQLGLAYAGLGQKDEAIREGKRATELLPVTEDAYAGAALADNLAHVYAMVGEYAGAIDEIESLLSVDAPLSIPWLRVDPTWDPLRDDPRFQSLLEEGG